MKLGMLLHQALRYILRIGNCLSTHTCGDGGILPYSKKARYKLSPCSMKHFRFVLNVFTSLQFTNEKLSD